MKRLIEGIRIWDGADRLVEDGAILIDGDTIETVLTREVLSSYELPPPGERIDASGKLAIPGLINAHTHLYSSLARGMARELASQSVSPIDDIRASADYQRQVIGDLLARLLRDEMEKSSGR